jgi:hypothetical protein
MSDQLTDAHYSWAASFCGVPDLSSESTSTQSGGNGDGNAPSNGSTPAQAVTNGASTAVAGATDAVSAGEDPGVGVTGSGFGGVASTAASATSSAADAAISEVGDTGVAAANVGAQVVSEGQKLATDGGSEAVSGEAVDAASNSGETDGSPRLKNFLTDAAAVVAGAGVHAVAGAVPLGFAGSTAIDAEVAAKGTPEENFWYGAGSLAAGVVDATVGVGEVAGGVLAAPLTGGLSLAVSLEGVNEMAASAEAITAGVAFMSTGSPGDGGGGDFSGGGKPTPGPRRADKLRAEYEGALQRTQDSNYDSLVDDAEADLKALDKAQDEYEACDTKDPAIMNKEQALKEAQEASEHSLTKLQNEFTGRSGVLPGSSKFANGRIYYDQGNGLKFTSAWTDENGPLEFIQSRKSLDSLPELRNKTNVTRVQWKGARYHYQVYAKGGGMLEYSVISSVIDGQELWSWVLTSHSN